MGASPMLLPVTSTEGSTPCRGRTRSSAIRADTLLHCKPTSWLSGTSSGPSCSCLPAIILDSCSESLTRFVQQRHSVHLEILEPHLGAMPQCGGTLPDIIIHDGAGGSHRDIFASVPVDQLRRNRLICAARQQRHRGFTIHRHMHIGPVDQSDEDGIKRPATFGKAVFVSRRTGLIGLPLQNAVGLELPEPIRQNVARNAQAFLHRIEAPDAQKTLPNDQHSPTVTNDRQAAGNRARVGVKLIPFHDSHISAIDRFQKRT